MSQKSERGERGERGGEGAGEGWNAGVESAEALPSPAAMRREAPLSEAAREAVERGRREVGRIVGGEDGRLLVVAGPCSIHDVEAGLDYARRLAGLREELGETMALAMRCYFEKPRTGEGWKGRLNDPGMDGSFEMERGLREARGFLLEVAGLGLPAAAEALDPMAPMYLWDLISWTAIGARTAESQTHREMASWLPTAVGFKNGTDGGVEAAVAAALAARRPHAFLGVGEDGRASVVRSKGNERVHLVLRGGGGRPNYDSVSVARAAAAMERAGLRARLMVDCSHANSDKKPELQARALRDVARQRIQGQGALMGVMLESNLKGGSQLIPKDLGELAYGQSVTDACLGWEETAELLREVHRELMEAKKRGGLA